MTTICDEPENASLRQIRIKNPNFQEDIARWVGGEECLLALGFTETELNKVCTRLSKQ